MPKIGQTVHPFPARMAPELVSQYIDGLPAGATVLDPMMGSGTFAIAAAVAGHKSIGVDRDPLAVLITKASSWRGDRDELLGAVEEVLRSRDVEVADVVTDEETRGFIDYWFDGNAQRSLARLAWGIDQQQGHLHAPLWCAFSRLIITKDAGASRARDVSHSRPHVVRDAASFDPATRFRAAVDVVLTRGSDLTDYQGDLLHLVRGDARNLPLLSGSIDAVMTSPPYLNAIDYLRGHRMSLVWMGHSVAELRDLRGTNIGTERGADLDPQLVAVREAVTDGTIDQRRTKIINRYLVDLDKLLAEIARVLKGNGAATFVVANSTVRGGSFRADDAIALVGARHGLPEVVRSYRELPDNRRYLPTPANDGSQLGKRMRSETVLTMYRTASQDLAG